MGELLRLRSLTPRARRVRPGARVVPLTVLCILALSACGGSYTPVGPWMIKPQGPPPVVAPPLDPQPGQSPGVPGQGAEGEDPNIVATGLSVPTGLVVLSDGTALVGERTTGRLLQVFPDGSPPVELMVVPGLDVSGDGGLLGLAVSSTFDEDKLIYAYLTTREDNRVVKFPLGGTPNPVFTGIPKGATHNGGALIFGADDALYVGTGDTGASDLAADEQNLAGKVLRINIFGEPAGPEAIYTSGHSDVTSLCLGLDGQLFGTDRIDGGSDEVNVLIENGVYGWPRPDSGAIDPILEIDSPGDGLGGCALAGQTIAVGALEGRRIYTSQLDPQYSAIGDVQEFAKDTYGRLRTLVFDSQGALWVTTSNRDGNGAPVEDDDRVLRILAPPIGGGGGGTS